MKKYINGNLEKRLNKIIKDEWLDDYEFICEYLMTEIDGDFYDSVPDGVIENELSELLSNERCLRLSKLYSNEL